LNSIHLYFLSEATAQNIALASYILLHATTAHVWRTALTLHLTQCDSLAQHNYLCTLHHADKNAILSKLFNAPATKIEIAIIHQAVNEIRK